MSVSLGWVLLINFPLHTHLHKQAILWKNTLNM